MLRSGTLLRLTGCLAVAILAIGTAGCVTPQDIEGLQSQLSDIQRQSPSKEEVSSQVSSLGTSVGRQMESLLKTEADMQVKLQGLSSQIDELQAKLEDTNYRLSQLSQQIATTNQELKSFRSTAPPSAGEPDGTQPQAPPPAGNPGNPGGNGPSADPQALYNGAYNDYLKGSYDLALREFQEYLDNFPATDLADNATYWIGECYYRQRKFRQAVDQFNAVMEKYPRSDKVAAATLKKGYAHLELGERPQGVVQLRHVIRQYPNSDEANLARQRLREIGVDAG
jgi:tol-pal system protein YbgF